MKDKETQTKYEDYINALSYYLYAIKCKTQLFKYLNKKLNENGDEIELAPVLFGPILESLLVDSIISLAKLYEGDRSKRNLVKFLNFVESNIKKITWRDKQFTANEIKCQKNSIIALKPVVEIILNQRDKFFAHHDKKYFNDRGALSDDFPLKNSDIEKAICVAEKIITKHSLELNGSIPITMDNAFVLAIDKMFSNLRDFHDKQEK